MKHELRRINGCGQLKEPKDFSNKPKAIKKPKLKLIKPKDKIKI